MTDEEQQARSFDEEYDRAYEGFPCPTCGESVVPFGRRCDRCERNLEEDRLERENGR